MVIVLRVIWKLPAATGRPLSIEFDRPKVCRTNTDELTDERKHLITHEFMSFHLNVKRSSECPSSGMRNFLIFSTCSMYYMRAY